MSSQAFLSTSRVQCPDCNDTVMVRVYDVS
jgi:hypothetical protein